MKKILLIAIIFCYQLSYATEQAIIAVVNDEPITDLDLKHRMELVINTNHLPRDDKSLQALRIQILQMLVDEKLFEKEAKKLGISVDDSDIEHSLDAIAQDLNIKSNQLNEVLKKNGVSLKELRNQLKHQILGAKLVKIQIEPFIRITDQDIRDYHVNQISEIDKNTSEKIKVSEIVFFPDSNKFEEAKNLAVQLVKQLKSGANFATMAKNFSQSISAENGGEIGWLYFDQLSKEFLDATRFLKPGDISEPIITEDSIYILKILDKQRHDQQKPKEVSPIDSIKDEELRQALKQKKMDIQVKGFILKLRKDAFIDIKAH